LAGWIAPNGAYFRIDFARGHVTKAREITGSGDEAFIGLELAGWAHLGASGMVDLGAGCWLTNNQKNTLLDLAALVRDRYFRKNIAEAVNS
jgi:hypothetical protein